MTTTSLTTTTDSITTTQPTTTTTTTPINQCRETFQGEVERIIDGDTLVLKECKERIRLALVNTPERGEGGYLEATNFTSILCKVDSLATIDQDKKQPIDKYGRIIALVYCQDKNLNAELVYNKLGVIDTRFCYTSEFSNEDWAYNHGCGTSENVKKVIETFVEISKNMFWFLKLLPI